MQPRECAAFIGSSSHCPVGLGARETSTNHVTLAATVTVNCHWSLDSPRVEHLPASKRLWQANLLALKLGKTPESLHLVIFPL